MDEYKGDKDSEKGYKCQIEYRPPHPEKFSRPFFIENCEVNSLINVKLQTLVRFKVSASWFPHLIYQRLVDLGKLKQNNQEFCIQLTQPPAFKPSLSRDRINLPELWCRACRACRVCRV